MIMMHGVGDGGGDDDSEDGGGGDDDGGIGDDDDDGGVGDDGDDDEELVAKFQNCGNVWLYPCMSECCNLKTKMCNFSYIFSIDWHKHTICP